MSGVALFTDGSVNPLTHIGYGAYLLVHDVNQLPVASTSIIHVQRFENTSSSTLELQTLLWALADITAMHDQPIKIYTDSQSIIHLLQRRAQLEKNHYYANNNKRLKHYLLYQQFYNVIDVLQCELVKVNGHSQQHHKNNIDRIFSLVDRAARAALRNS